MKLSEFKTHLDKVSDLRFVTLGGTLVPSHFHITEAGLTTKHFIDCGGTVRTEKNISFQLWTADDVEHRLEPQKLQKIIALAEPLFGSEDVDIEIEYQTETISRFGVEFDGSDFLLTAKQTDCLAKDNCGIPKEKPKVRLSVLQHVENSNCTPGGGCC